MSGAWQRRMKTATAFDNEIRFVHFIQNCAEERGIPQLADPRCLYNIP
jgi:hypothetical protein